MDLVELADHLRDKGMSLAATAEAFVQPDFSTAAYRMICALAQSQETLFVDDLLDALDIEPSHPNAFGSVWMRAIRNHIIAPTGERRKSKDPKKHAHQYVVYKSLICRRAPMEKPLWGAA